MHTGHVLTREELDTGYLADQLIDSDYDLTTSVSGLSPFLPQSMPTTLQKLENL